MAIVRYRRERSRTRQSRLCGSGGGVWSSRSSGNQERKRASYAQSFLPKNMTKTCRWRGLAYMLLARLIYAIDRTRSTMNEDRSTDLTLLRYIRHVVASVYGLFSYTWKDAVNDDVSR